MPFDALESMGCSVLKVDVGQVESLAARYSVSSIPHFLFLKDGEVVDTMTGASKPLLKSKLEAMK